MSKRAPKPAPIPLKAQKEVLEKLSSRSNIPKKELVEIGLRNGVKGDPEKLQISYIRQQMQRFLAGLRDDEGNRLVMAEEDRYVLLDGCGSQKALEGIHNRLQNQIRGLERTDRKVQGYIEAVKRTLARLAGQDSGE